MSPRRVRVIIDLARPRESRAFDDETGEEIDLNAAWMSFGSGHAKGGVRLIESEEAGSNPSARVIRCYRRIGVLPIEDVLSEEELRSIPEVVEDPAAD